MTAHIPKAWSPRGNGDVTDGFLWVSFRRGDREALEKLYSLHAGGMYRYGLKLCGDPDLVKDGIQDLFSRLWSTREFISNAGCVQMYLYRSLRRAVLGEIIKRRKHFAGAKNSHTENLDCSIEDQVIVKEINREQFKLLRSKLDLLTRHQREVIILRFFNGLSYKQIAEIMGLQIDSVYNLTSKGLEILRSKRILS
jgi:RNA polymerase sigma factor (sigma-70 family)